MADKKISQLPVASSVTGSDLLEIVQSGTNKQANVSQLPTGSGGITAPLTENDYGGSFIIPDGGLLNQPGRLTLTGSNRLTLRGTGRLRLFNPINTPSGAFTYEPGSFYLGTGQILRQNKRLTLAGSQRMTLTGNSRLRLWDEPSNRPYGYWDAVVQVSGSDFTVPANSILFNITGLSYQAQGNAVYEFELFLKEAINGASPGFNVAISSSSSGASMTCVGLGYASTTFTTIGSTSIGTSFGSINNNGSLGVVWLKGHVNMGASDGNIVAGITGGNNGNGGTVYIGSNLKVKKIK